MAATELADLLRRVIEARLADVHVCLPGSVQSYDPVTQTATIALQVKKVLVDPDGQEVVTSFPPLPNVPIAWPRGGGFFLTMPLAAGDNVMVMFCERAIGKWRTTGVESDPGDLALHSLSHAWAIPAIYPDAQALAGVPTTEAAFGYASGPLVRLYGGTGMVEIGPMDDAGLDFVVKATPAQHNDDVLASSLANLKGAISAWTPVPNDGGAALKVALTDWLAAVDTYQTVASTKTKVV